MEETYSKSKQIARNTLLLYLRMFIIMLIGLYTSRVVLRTLGVADYGIYNVVGGLISMTAFLNSAIAGAAQRFFSYELGQNNFHHLRTLFSTTLIIYIILAIIIVLVLETIGIWFLNNKLNIELERMNAANWVFQCSLIVLVLNMLNAPYNAIIIAHERMDTYAIISIVEAIIKLGLVSLLVLSRIDRLIAYAIFQVIGTFIVRLCYKVYCTKNFNETRICFSFDKESFKKLFSYSSWNLVGNIGFTLKDPLSNVIFNIFCGTTVNAARGIALQVNSLVCVFSSNLSTALNPSIIKSYSAKNYMISMEYVYAGARLSFFLISVVAIPIILNIDFLLNLWLGNSNVPKYTSQFVLIIVVLSLIQSLTSTISTAVQATGNIKLFSIGVCLIPLLELPITYFLLHLGCHPFVALCPSIAISVLTLFFRYYVLTRQLTYYRWKPYLLNVVLRSVVVFVIALLFCWFLTLIPFSNNTLRFFVISIASVFICCSIFSLLALEKKEKEVLFSKIESLICHGKKCN